MKLDSPNCMGLPSNVRLLLWDRKYISERFFNLCEAINSGFVRSTLHHFGCTFSNIVPPDTL